MKYLNVEYPSWSSQNSQKLQNNASSHYPTTIFALCIYFLQYETPLFRIHVFRTRRPIYTSWLQHFNFKLGAVRHEKKRGLAFHTGTSCLKHTFSVTSDFRQSCSTRRTFKTSNGPTSDSSKVLACYANKP